MTTTTTTTTTTSPLESADEKAPHFVSMRGTGFQVFFANGWGVSIQFGTHNYCDNRRWDLSSAGVPAKATCNNAEVAVITPEGDLLRLGGDTVHGWVPPDAAAKLITVVQAFASDIEHKQATALCAAVLEES